MNNLEDIKKSLKQEVLIDEALFEQSFYEWLERHGVKLGEFIPASRCFNAVIDLNKLCLGITELRERQESGLLKAYTKHNE